MDPLYIKTYYINRIDEINKITHLLTRQSKIISRWRLAVFLIAALWTWYLWSQPLFIAIGLAVLGAIFIYLVSRSTKSDHALNLQRHILSINLAEVKSLEGQYHFRKSGEQYLSAFSDRINSMTRDLDIYGQGSLYQYINRAMSDQGRDKLADAFIHKYTPSEVVQRQAAIKELAPMIEWRQQWMALQMDKPIQHETRSILQQWIDNAAFKDIAFPWKIMAWVLPLITFGMTALWGFGAISMNDYILYGLGVFIVLAFMARIATAWFKPLHRIRHELETMSPCLKSIESQIFTSSWTNTYVSNIKNPMLSSHSITALNKILDRFDFRLNPIVFIPLNFFLCWDLHQVLSLDRWRKKFNGNIASWFECIAEIESLSSFAQLAFNHPSWVYPVLADTWHTLESKGLAHPLLLPSKAVANDFSLVEMNRIALITGSNMAGKSTFLRSVGANIILANTGSPVHATYFLFSPGQVLTSMRISDNLQEETSTFYAELKKIKIILDAVNAKENVIILIDEMLRGTNAEDRRIGSHGFIKQIIALGAIGIVASHDTSLATFTDLYPGVVRTYYFDSYLEKDEIRFDYTIKPGVCTSANASYLMKKMGIDI